MDMNERMNLSCCICMCVCVCVCDDGYGYSTFTAPDDDDAGAPPLGFTFSSLFTPSCAKRASICRMLIAISMRMCI